jgi:formate hydrogenlyase subunit 7
MSSWISRSWRKGIVTSRYPEVNPTEEEMPLTGRPPGVPVDADSGSLLLRGGSLCPTGAIDPTGIHQGRCVRCTRCQAAGFRFSGTGEVAAATSDELFWPEGKDRPRDRANPPLVEIRRSVHVFLMDVGSCQACNLEVLSLANPYYDAHRLGISFTNSPRHADVLVVVGVPTISLAEPLRRTYEALPAPKAVMAVGACALDGGIFRGNPGTTEAVREIVPIDLFIPGCPPPPIAVLNGLLTLIGRQRLGRTTPE